MTESHNGGPFSGRRQQHPSQLDSHKHFIWCRIKSSVKKTPSNKLLIVSMSYNQDTANIRGQTTHSRSL